MKTGSVAILAGLLAACFFVGSTVQAAECPDSSALIDDAQLKQVCEAKETLGKIKEIIDKLTGEEGYLPLGEPLKKALNGVSGYLETASNSVEAGLEMVSVLDDLEWAKTTVECMSQSTATLESESGDLLARKGLAYGAAHLFTIFGQMMGASEEVARKRFGPGGLRASTPLMAYAPAVLNARQIFLAVEEVLSDCRGHQQMCAALCSEPSDIQAWACSQTQETELVGACGVLKARHSGKIEGGDPKLPSIQDVVKRALQALPDDAVPNRAQLIDNIDQAYQQITEAQKWFSLGTDLEESVCAAQQAITTAALTSGGLIYPLEPLWQLQKIHSCPWYVFYRNTIIRTWGRPMPPPPEGDAYLLGMSFLVVDPRGSLQAGSGRRDLGELRIANSFAEQRIVSLRFEVGAGGRCGDNATVDLDPTSQSLLPRMTRTVPFQASGSLPGEVENLLASSEPVFLCAAMDVLGVSGAEAPGHCVCQPLL